MEDVEILILVDELVDEVEIDVLELVLDVEILVD